MVDLTCAALEWDRKQKDYIECDEGKAKLVRITGIVIVEVALCDTHRWQFEEELERFGGWLDKQKRVEVIRIEEVPCHVETAVTPKPT